MSCIFPIAGVIGLKAIQIVVSGCKGASPGTRVAGKVSADSTHHSRNYHLGDDTFGDDSFCFSLNNENNYLYQQPAPY